MNKHFPWVPVGIAALIVALGGAGAYGLLKYMGEPSWAKSVGPARSAVWVTTPTGGSGAAAGEQGYLVVKVNVAGQMEGAERAKTAHGSAVVTGFSTSCPGKVVMLDFRAIQSDLWAPDDAATPSLEATLCFPSKNGGIPTASLISDLATAQVEVDGDDVKTHPAFSPTAFSRAVVLDTGVFKYLLLASVGFWQECDDDCGAGASAGISVTRVFHNASEARFNFIAPVDEESNVEYSSVIAL